MREWQLGSVFAAPKASGAATGPCQNQLDPKVDHDKNPKDTGAACDPNEHLEMKPMSTQTENGGHDKTNDAEKENRNRQSTN